MKIFETFTIGKVKYLAIPNGQYKSMCDECGNHFGSWDSISAFKKHLENQPNSIYIGRCVLHLPCPMTQEAFEAHAALHDEREKERTA